MLRGGSHGRGRRCSHDTDRPSPTATHPAAAAGGPRGRHARGDDPRRRSCPRPASVGVRAPEPGRARRARQSRAVGPVTALPAAAPRRRPALARPQIEIVVPVYNEEAALELSVRRLHRYLTAEFPFTWRIVIADNASTDATDAIAANLARRAAVGLRPAARAQGPRARAARRVVAERRAGRLLHGRRPLDRPARPAPARRAAALGSQRPGDRHAARARRAGGPRAQARGHLARVQRAAADRPARAVQRRAVRLQGGARRPAGGAAPRGPRRRLVLRHRAARGRPAARAADPRGAGRLDRRSRLARADRAHGGGRPARRGPADGGRPARPFRGGRRGQHDRPRAALPSAARRCWAPPVRTRSRSR